MGSTSKHPSISPAGLKKGNLLAKPNYQYEKRQRDLAKKQKQEEKRRQKQAGKANAEGGGQDAAQDADETARSDSGGGVKNWP
jgi:hypothetical protein